MNWGSLDAFLSMGGYGLYVWGSYAVTFALIAAEIGAPHAPEDEACRAEGQSSAGRVNFWLRFIKR